jgi:uncharacterized membrane protein SirB2
MTATADWMLALVMVAVVAILALGTLNMARGGSPGRSQRLMRWRVALQAVALVLVMAILWLGR